MPKLLEIYVSLMDDPDVVPPQDVTKEKYALMLAQQRVKQHENNEKALNLGLVKLLKTGTKFQHEVNTNGHSTNGHSSNGRSSAVKNLASFVNKDEDILEQALLLMLKKGVPDVITYLQDIGHQKFGPEENPIKPEEKGKEDSGLRDFFKDQRVSQHPDTALANAGLTPEDAGDLVYDTDMESQRTALKKVFNDSFVHLNKLNELTDTMNEDETIEDRLERHETDNPEDFKELEEGLKNYWSPNGAFIADEEINRLKNRGQRLKQIKDWSEEQGLDFDPDHRNLSVENYAAGPNVGKPIPLNTDRINSYLSDMHTGDGDVPKWTGPTLKTTPYRARPARPRAEQPRERSSAAEYEIDPNAVAQEEARRAQAEQQRQDAVVLEEPPSSPTPAEFPPINDARDLINLSDAQLRELAEHHESSNAAIARHLKNKSDSDTLKRSLGTQIFKFKRSDMAGGTGEANKEEAEPERTPLDPVIASALKEIYDHTDFAPGGQKEGLEGAYAHKSFEDRFRHGEFHDPDTGDPKTGPTLSTEATAFQDGRDDAHASGGAEVEEETSEVAPAAEGYLSEYGHHLTPRDYDAEIASHKEAYKKAQDQYFEGKDTEGGYNIPASDEFGGETKRSKKMMTWLRPVLDKIKNNEKLTNAEHQLLKTEQERQLTRYKKEQREEFKTDREPGAVGTILNEHEREIAHIRMEQLGIGTSPEIRAESPHAYLDPETKQIMNGDGYSYVPMSEVTKAQAKLTAPAPPITPQEKLHAHLEGLGVDNPSDLTEGAAFKSAWEKNYGEESSWYSSANFVDEFIEDYPTATGLSELQGEQSKFKAAVDAHVGTAIPASEAEMRHYNYHQKLRMNEDLNAAEHKEFLTTIAEKEKAGTDIFTPEEQQHRTDYRNEIDNLKDPSSEEAEVEQVDDADKTEAQRLVKDHILDAKISTKAKTAVRRAFNATSLEDLAANEFLVDHLKELDGKDETIDWKHGGASNPTQGIKNYLATNFDVHSETGIVQGPKVEPAPVTEEASSEGASAEKESPKLSDLDTAYAAIKEHVDAKGGTFNAEHREFQGEGIEDMDGATDWINENDDGGVFTSEGSKRIAQGHLDKYSDKIEAINAEMTPIDHDSPTWQEEYDQKMNNAAQEFKDNVTVLNQDHFSSDAWMETAIQAQGIQRPQIRFQRGTSAETVEDEAAEANAAAAPVPEGDWPEETDENKRTIDNKLRFADTRSAIDTAKRYGLMHPNGTYTDLGHKFLNEIGDLYDEAAGQIINTDIAEGQTKSPRDSANSYILLKKNEAIQDANDRKTNAWQKRRNKNDPNHPTYDPSAAPAGDEPTLANTQLKPEVGANYNLTDSTLTNRTITHSTFVSLKDALNKTEGTDDAGEPLHESHNWLDSYDPETGVLKEGIHTPARVSRRTGRETRAEVPHSANESFNLDHFDFKDEEGVGSGRGKLIHALFSNLIGADMPRGIGDLAILNHEIAWMAYHMRNAGASSAQVAQMSNTTRENATGPDGGVDLGSVGESQQQIDEEIGDAPNIATPIMGSGNTPDFNTMVDIDAPAIQALRQMTGGATDAATAEADYETRVPETHEELIDRAKEDGLLDHILDTDKYGYSGKTKGEREDHLKAKLAAMDEDKLRKFLQTSDKAMETKKVNAAKERTATAKANTTAAQGRQADAEDAEGDEPSVSGAMQREKLLHRLAKYQGIDTDDAEAMDEFAEDHGEDIYTNNEIRGMVKAAHSLDKNGKSQKNTADKAEAARAALANAQIHLGSSRYPSHEDFVKQFEEARGRKPNAEEIESAHTQHARELLHYWHDNKESFLGTEAQGKFDAKIQEYLTNGADFKGLSEDIDNMEAQGIDLGDSKARDKYYEKKAYNENQPRLSDEHHIERLRSALANGHHDRVNMGEDSETGEPISGHMRRGKDGKMEIVPSEEAGRDGGEIVHSESSDAPRLQHHKADGKLDEEAQALYQKSHEARQGMSRDEQAHAAALENENSEHEKRIAKNQAAHDTIVETSEQEYQDVKGNVDFVRKMNEERAAREHEGGLKPHVQKHEKWDSEISEYEDTHAKEERRFADTESKIHENHETEMGRLDDQVVRDHENLEDEGKAIPQRYAAQRTELQEAHENERAERQERHDEEIQNARDTFEEQLRDSPDFKDMSQDDPLYQQEIQSQLQSLREQHAEEYEAQTTRQRAEQEDVDTQEDEAHKKLDADHNRIDERKDDEQRLVGNSTSEALQQNADTNQEQYDGIVSAINERRAERGDPLITEGLTRGQRGGAGILDIATVEREAHDQSYEAGKQELIDKRDAALKGIREKGEANLKTAENAKTQKQHESSSALSAATKTSNKDRVANRAKLNADRPEMAARTKATDEADEAFKNHMGQVELVRDDEHYEADNPEGDKPENMIQRGTNAEGHARASAALRHPELGATSAKKKEAHDEDQEGEDREGKKGQTRMVTDPVTKEQKQQVWIPGRGKGWVDKDKMKDAMGSNADAAGDTSSHPDGKVVIYPPGHFHAGIGEEGEKGYEPPSSAMVGHGGNLYAVASEHIDPDDPEVAGMGHEDYLANNLAGALQGHDFSAGVHSGIDAAGLGLHLSDHPATLTAKDRKKAQRAAQAKPVLEGWKAKFREGLEGGTPEEVKRRKDAAEKIASGSPGAVKRLADHSSVAAGTASGQFRGATNWLAGKGIGLGQTFAEGMRSERYSTESMKGKKYPKKGVFSSYTPKTEHKASLGDELWRLPGMSPFRPSNVRLRHALEDRREQASGLQQLSDHLKEQAAKVESRRTGKT